jgi:hypothetical protein
LTACAVSPLKTSGSPSRTSPSLATNSLRSLFRALKRERLIFQDPTRPRSACRHCLASRSVAQRPIARFAKSRIRHPTQARRRPRCRSRAVCRELRHLQLTDLDRSSGRLATRRHHGTRTVVLDELTFGIVTDWIRGRHAALGTNRHLFVGQQSAVDLHQADEQERHRRHVRRSWHLCATAARRPTHPRRGPTHDRPGPPYADLQYHRRQRDQARQDRSPGTLQDRPNRALNAKDRAGVRLHDDGTHPRQGDHDETVNLSIGRLIAGGCQGAQAGSREFVGRDIIPDVADLDGLGQQASEHVTQVLRCSGDVLVWMQASVRCRGARVDDVVLHGGA